MKSHTTAERKSERELVVTRTINGPARLTFEAWANADLFKQWWVPKSFGITLLSCETDVRTGGKYRLVFAGNPDPMAFFGRYLEVVPGARIVWTNEEGGADGPITTVTFEDVAGKTRLVVTELYPSKEALDTALATGQSGMDSMDETLGQLEALIVARGSAELS